MTAIGIILVLLSFSAHELGHAFAMRNCGVKIAKISLLGLGPTLVNFRVPAIFGDADICIKLIPLGAFVKPSEENYTDNLSHNQKTYIYGAGVIANVLYSSIVLTLAFCFGGHMGLTIRVILLVSFIIGCFPKFTSHGILIIGLALMGLLIYSLALMNLSSAPEIKKNLIDNSGSVIMITQEVAKHDTSLFDTISYAALISLVIGLAQTLPLYPLDGGRIADNLICRMFRNKKYPGLIFKISGTILVLALITLSIGADIERIIKMVF